MPDKFQMTLEWTLAICVKAPAATWQMKPQLIHVHDLDATLCIAYWDEGDGVYGWELTSATIDGIKVDATTDRDMHQIVKRAVDFHDSDINERVQDFAHLTVAA